MCHSDARGDLAWREASGVHEFSAKVAIAREVGERPRHRTLVTHACAHVFLDTAAQLVLMGNKGDAAYLGPTLLDGQPPENLVDDRALVHDPAENDVLVCAAAQEVSEKVADVVKHHTLGFLCHLERIGTPAPVPVEHDGCGQHPVELAADGGLAHAHGAADEVQGLGHVSPFLALE